MFRDPDKTDQIENRLILRNIDKITTRTKMQTTMNTTPWV